MARSKAFFINGGAGRVLCSIPAFERYAEDSGDSDFVIVCEGGMDLYRGHPVLQNKAYEVWHKGLFNEHLKDKDLVTLEPYRINAYFNQECSLAQAFDIEINGLDEPRELPKPTLKLSKQEMVTGYQTIQEMKAGLKKDKIVIVQPFGRSITPMGDFMIDPTSRSFEVQNIVNIIDQLRVKYGVCVMSELPLPLTKNPDHQVAMPKEPNLRLWASMIASADHFLGCDSLGQHLAKAFDKTATVVTGSTIPINISYVDDENFDILDMGATKGRVYSPIRISMDDELDRMNDGAMMLEVGEEQMVVDSVIEFMGTGGTFKGQAPTPMQAQGGSCGTPAHNKPDPSIPTAGGQPHQMETPNYDFEPKNLLGEDK